MKTRAEPDSLQFSAGPLDVASTCDHAPDLRVVVTLARMLGAHGYSLSLELSGVTLPNLRRVSMCRGCGALWWAS